MRFRGGFMLIHKLAAILVLAVLVALPLLPNRSSRGNAWADRCIKNRAELLMDADLSLPRDGPFSPTTRLACPSGGEYRMKRVGRYASIECSRHRTSP